MHDLKPTVTTMIDDTVTLVINHTATESRYAADVEITLPATSYARYTASVIKLECSHSLLTGQLTMRGISAGPNHTTHTAFEVTGNANHVKIETNNFLQDQLIEVESIEVSVLLYRGQLLQRFSGSSEDEAFAKIDTVDGRHVQ